MEMNYYGEWVLQVMKQACERIQKIYDDYVENTKEKKALYDILREANFKDEIAIEELNKKIASLQVGAITTFTNPSFHSWSDLSNYLLRLQDSYQIPMKQRITCRIKIHNASRGMNFGEVRSDSRFDEIIFHFTLSLPN